MSEPMELTGVKAKAMALRIIADLLADTTTLRHTGRAVVFEHDDDPEPIRTRFLTFEHRGRRYRTVIVDHGDHRVEMTVSQTGRSVHIDNTIPTQEKTT